MVVIFCLYKRKFNPNKFLKLNVVICKVLMLEWAFNWLIDLLAITNIKCCEKWMHILCHNKSLLPVYGTMDFLKKNLIKCDAHLPQKTVFAPWAAIFNMSETTRRAMFKKIVYKVVFIRQTAHDNGFSSLFNNGIEIAYVKP